MAGSLGQRTLAAIVFTDAVGFSKVASLNEPHALAMLHHDFDLMRAVCEDHQGRVMNVTGDGLLMMFSSAVDAMRCALKIQEKLFQANREKPESALLHRIGVHLGDVIVEDDNVFGDGVNVASRLQGEARPGSICLSRTVYDVVKNKVPMTATYLGPRVLKNISERVMVWQVPPMGEPVDSGAATPFDDLEPEEQGASGLKSAGLIAISVILIGVVIGGALVVRAKSAGTPSSTSHRNLATNPPPEREHTSDHASASDPSQTDIQKTLEALRQAYEFGAVVTTLQQQGLDKQSDGPLMVEKYQALADMRQWLDSQLGSVQVGSPLRANVDLGQGEVSCAVYTSPTGLVVDPGASPQVSNLWKLPPGSIYNIGIAASQLPGAPSGATAWMQSFAQEYQVSR